METKAISFPDPARVAILISGRGSNMVALADAICEPDFPATAALVLSSSWNAPGLELARQRGIEVCICDQREFSERNLHEAALGAALKNAGADIICLAGYMRVLSGEFVDQWKGRLINIHPSLLPAFKGLNTHERALKDGVKTHGCSVHFVTAELDGGPVIARSEVPVHADDDAESLGKRVLDAEHILYPKALRMVLAGEARLAL